MNNCWNKVLFSTLTALITGITNSRPELCHSRSLNQEENCVPGLPRSIYAMQDPSDDLLWNLVDRRLDYFISVFLFSLNIFFFWFQSCSRKTSLFQRALSHMLTLQNDLLNSYELLSDTSTCKTVHLNLIYIKVGIHHASKSDPNLFLFPASSLTMMWPLRAA